MARCSPRTSIPGRGRRWTPSRSSNRRSGKMGPSRRPARAGPCHGQYLRRRDLPGPSARLHRREDPHHTGTRPATPKHAVWAGHHVHRCRPGHRDDRGARLMAAYERILVEINDHIGTVTLNRPDKANAFDPDMCDDLLEAVRMLATADAVRVIVITGAGRAFCAGADLGVLGTQ